MSAEHDVISGVRLVESILARVDVPKTRRALTALLRLVEDWQQACLSWRSNAVGFYR